MDAEGWNAAAARGALVGSEADAVRLVRDMLAAVAALHSVSVVHADIKVPRRFPASPSIPDRPLAFPSRRSWRRPRVYV